MSVHPKLLEILVCPISKQPLEKLDIRRLDLLNEAIAAGSISQCNGELVSECVFAALITRNDKVIYTVEDNIPIMLEEQSIYTHQIPGW